MCLDDSADNLTRHFVKTSNRKYELGQILGSEITDKIEEASKSDLSFTIPVLSGAGLLITIGYFSERKEPISRSKFLGKLFGYGFIGISTGLLCGTVVEYAYDKAAFKNYLEDELIPVNKDKEKEIREYVSLKYPMS